MSTHPIALVATTTVPDASSARLIRRERHGQWLMVAGGLLLGTLGVFVQEAGQDPLTTVWFRCVFGSLALLAWGAAAGRLGELRLSGRGLGVALATGGLMMLNWALFFAAIHRTSIGVATVVFHVQPLWVMALGAWWLREKVSGRQWLAALVALAGLGLASGLLDEPASAAALDAGYLWGLALCLGGSLSYALVTLLAKAVPQVSGFALAWWQSLVGVVVLAWWPVLHGWPVLPASWAWLAGLGVLHTGLAYAIMYAGMARLPAGRIAMLQFVYPGAAVLVDWAWYGRMLSPTQFAGVALMALALSGLRRK